MTASIPQRGLVSAITAGGTAVTVAQPPINGCYIVNPLSAADQGIGTAEPLYVDPTGTAAILGGYGTCVTLAPGQTWAAVPGAVSGISVNAATTNHRFTVVRW